MKRITGALDLAVGLDVAGNNIGVGQDADGFLEESFEAFFHDGRGMLSVELSRHYP
jgi:hypothetical protein